MSATRERGEGEGEDRFQRVPRRRRAPSGGGKGEGRPWAAPRSEVNLSENALGTRALRDSPRVSDSGRTHGNRRVYVVEKLWEFSSREGRTNFGP